jgi:hypothetical protein
MTTSTRPLPTLIGPIENALRALLGSLVAASPVPTYEEWAVMNLVASSEIDDQVGAILDGLQCSGFEAAAILTALSTRGLIEERDERWFLTTYGVSVLEPLRVCVASVSSTLTAGIDDRELDAARRVPRKRAEESDRRSPPMTIWAAKLSWTACGGGLPQRPPRSRAITPGCPASESAAGTDQHEGNRG